MKPDLYRNILCVRADNMGDVIMSSPAIRALKETYGCRITLLTSSAGAVIAPYLDCIDEVIVADLPWVKTSGEHAEALLSLTEELKSRNFDGGIIFTVYSQSSLPAATLLFMAGVPVRAAYARENPYDLINRWLPDNEPYEHISHQVQRDLDLVANLGARAADERLKLRIESRDQENVEEKLRKFSIDLHSPYIILHPGVSEKKREYPAELWIRTGQMLSQKCGLPLLVTGAVAELSLQNALLMGSGREHCPSPVFSQLANLSASSITHAASFPSIRVPFTLLPPDKFHRSFCMRKQILSTHPGAVRMKH